MDTEALRRELQENKDNAERIAEAVIADTALLPGVIESIASPSARVRFRCVKVLRLISEKRPELLYPRFEFFVGLLDSANNILKWNAIDIIANLASVDTDDRFGGLFQRFYSLLDEGSLITAAHVVQGSAGIVRARPALEPDVTSELLRAERIRLPTEECRSILEGKVIAAFSRYLPQARNKDRLLAFARSQLGNTRPATKRQAEQFLRKFGYQEAVMSPQIQVTVKQTRPVTVAFISVRGPFSGIPAAFGRLYGWIGQKGYKPRGPAMAVYYTIPGQAPDGQALWELRSQITGDVAASEPDEQGLGVKRLEAIWVAAAMHKGPYEKVEETYHALAAWVAENGHEVAGPPEEIYFNDPAETPPEELLTEVRMPIRRAQEKRQNVSKR